MAGDTFNQNHTGSGDNVVTFGKKPYAPQDEELASIILKINKDKPVHFDLVGQASQYYGKRLADMMAAQGFRIGSITLIGMRMITSTHPLPPKQSSDPVEISGTAQATLISIDTNA